ncbi:MAG: WecB/TagA/CpsF family glycosyltransferase [Candidatus Omnitrophica bacterium]|nr:WecB/TagA/CpsF family glycosyltransferase [Candidatus Omnitrophota bacterium]
MNDTSKKASFLGININLVDRKEIITLLVNYATQGVGRPRTAFYLNAHCVNIASRDVEYRAVLNSADLVYAGGQGVVWGGRLCGIPIPARVNIMDIFDFLAEEFRNRKISIFLLGETPETIGKADAALRTKGLFVVGSHHGYFTESQEKDVINKINAARPDIILVGLGVPKQEKWILRNRNNLESNLSWGVGGLFKIFAGYLQDTPSWIRVSGLEWLYLGIQDPKRLVSRYLLGNLIFMYRVLAIHMRRLCLKS